MHVYITLFTLIMLIILIDIMSVIPDEALSLPLLYDRGHEKRGNPGYFIKLFINLFRLFPQHEVIWKNIIFGFIT